MVKLRLVLWRADHVIRSCAPDSVAPAPRLSISIASPVSGCVRRHPDSDPLGRMSAKSQSTGGTDPPTGRRSNRTSATSRRIATSGIRTTPTGWQRDYEDRRGGHSQPPNRPADGRGLSSTSNRRPEWQTKQTRTPAQDQLPVLFLWSKKDATVNVRGLSGGRESNDILPGRPQDMLAGEPSSDPANYRWDVEDFNSPSE